MSSTSYVDAIVLFGDSLTQTCASGSLYQRMAQHYERRLDVVNRGFSGYNTRWALPVFKRVIRSHQNQSIRLLTLWLGANDSVNQGESQHVPLEEYKANLRQFIQLVTDPKSDNYLKDVRVILITPPPVIGKFRPDRDTSNTQLYAQACLAVAEELSLPAVDMYTAILQAAGGDTDDQLSPYFYDGLHLTSEGYQVLFDRIMSVIEQQHPDLKGVEIPLAVPDWSDVARSHAE
ncbi:SGNH hydrolase-type esterase domain-containing protein [Kockovaella imperatae]|uniref:SGNH hydrolase-type esterase domain-containing protein n=1 Tax=Kockovaella imperatae TaxID=4999 RepID=A0A1Y1UG06_9TREE|nr:SGNH hydrolase-type esterase domain-containing protein [Kockovaella imperatae]ORX36446.1 SGNH hydrolase-type esterase domain-containing protein [Kockovaella imperatae]